MGFRTLDKKGLAKCLIDADINAETLRLHITEIAAGTRAHPPHAHEGVEAFYVLEGQAALEVEKERYTLGPNEAAVLDPSKVHGLVNAGKTPLRYMVIIARQ